MRGSLVDRHRCSHGATKAEGRPREGDKPEGRSETVYCKVKPYGSRYGTHILYGTNQTKITITFTTSGSIICTGERDRAKQNVSRIAILTVCHAEQPIPVLYLRLSPLTAYHGSVATVRVAVIPIKTTRVTAIVTCALRLGM